MPSVSIALCIAAATSSRRGDAHAGEAVGIGQLHVVGAGDRRLGVVARVEELLPLAHHAQIAVVHDGHFDGRHLVVAG